MSHRPARRRGARAPELAQERAREPAWRQAEARARSARWATRRATQRTWASAARSPLAKQPAPAALAEVPLETLVERVKRCLSSRALPRSIPRWPRAAGRDDRGVAGGWDRRRPSISVRRRARWQ